MKGLGNYLKEKIRDFARSIGLPIFGVTSSDPLECLEPVLEKRRALKLDSPFEKNWQIEKRCRPRKSFPWARSILCFGMPYGEYEDEDNREKIFARYALVKDYHIVMREKLKKVGAYIKKLVGENFRYHICVDSFPIVERALAYRAGLGWYGKNCLLYNPQYGSWFFLGEVIVNIPLEEDEPLDRDGCKKCEECIKACPTGAIRQAYSLDARKCISCITQSPGYIPLELREKMGYWIYGCDICQEVCPHNGKRRSNDSLYSTDDTAYKLIELLNITEEQFREKYSGTVLCWAGRSIIRRNAAVALGNTGKQECIPRVEHLLYDEDPLVRAHTAWAVGKLGGVIAAEILRKAYGSEKDSAVKKEIENALSMT
ncbi:MAG TPA: tRNA epoxyqueuosine(34) reductase QueG [Peptococcaceae bacterium]|nr:MAG: Iron-sulfur cluster binding protein, putative [Clostridia bacterium 41_269]HBT20349.1 tRNA epoxyqueuosine(34) reductase QueG [Peptococcaceae bacterium]